MMESYLSYALIAVGIFTGYMALVNLFRRDRMKERLATAEGSFGLADEDDVPSPLAALCRGILMLIGTDVHAQKDLSTLLAQAGIRSPHAVTYFLFFKRIVQPIFLVIGGFLFLQVILTPSAATPFLAKLLHFLIAALLLVMGLFGANLYVSNRRQHRQKILLRSFPETLDLLLVCIESGLGLDAALGRVCAELKKSHPEITYELERTRIELTVLHDRVEALQGLADRTEIVPFKSLVAALIQTEKFGTALLDTLRVLSEDQRTTRLLTAETRAARIPVLITIPLILCILPSFVIVILGPPIIRVSEQGGLWGPAGTPK
jgi:tight adherence protein C